LQALRERKNVKDFSYVASIEEIERNNFNLSVNTYIEKEDTSEKIDIKVLNNQIQEIVKKNDFLRKEIDRLIQDLEVEDE
jgi:type I restriction-modification system, M subunit